MVAAITIFIEGPSTYALLKQQTTVVCDNIGVSQKLGVRASIVADRGETRMEKWEDFDRNDFEVCIGVMSALAIVVKHLGKSKMIDLTDLVYDVNDAKNKSRGQRVVPLALLLLFLDIMNSPLSDWIL
jgi:hypothetical protein